MKYVYDNIHNTICINEYNKGNVYNTVRNVDFETKPSPVCAKQVPVHFKQNSISLVYSVTTFTILLSTEGH